VIDVDHHHDNSRFGDANLIDGHASSTAEILVRIFDRLGIEITPEIAEALYVGLVTDTGRFQYRTTSPAALRLGARLVEAGVDVHRVFERVFESVQPGKLRLLGRVIDHAVPYCDGRLLISHVSRDDLALVEGDEATTEGLIDHLRAVEGVQVAGLIREQVPLADGSLGPNRVSLRSRGLIDVSAIARQSAGGGHKQAAGFSHPGSVDDIRRFIVAEVSAQLNESAA
jgi:phosphoesterase RecJ-like protein